MVCATSRDSDVPVQWLEMTVAEVTASAKASQFCKQGPNARLGEQALKLR